MHRLLLALISQSSCFSLLGAGVTGLGHHLWLPVRFLKLKVKHQHPSLVWWCKREAEAKGLRVPGHGARELAQ